MTADFDHIAQQYDEDFTNSLVGQYQRKQVWQYLDSRLNKHVKNILEINCGTGYDANYLAENGYNVRACDISPEMINVANSKYANMPNLKFEVCNTIEIQKKFKGQKFDVVFSNFGGLNCLSVEKMERFFEEVPTIVKPNGRLVLVIMGQYCLWEWLYFFAKLNWAKMFRRATNKAVAVNVNGKAVDTYYFTPKQIKKWAVKFNLLKLQAIGFAIPPSYLNSFFGKKPKTLSSFNSWDNRLKKYAWPAYLSDHYLIDLQLKKQA